MEINNLGIISNISRISLCLDFKALEQLTADEEHTLNILIFAQYFFFYSPLSTLTLQLKYTISDLPLAYQCGNFLTS